MSDEHALEFRIFVDRHGGLIPAVHRTHRPLRVCTGSEFASVSVHIDRQCTTSGIGRRQYKRARPCVDSCRDVERSCRTVCSSAELAPETVGTQQGQAVDAIPERNGVVDLADDVVMPWLVELTCVRVHGRCVDAAPVLTRWTANEPVSGFTVV